MFTFQLKFIPSLSFVLVCAAGLATAAEPTDLVRRLPALAEKAASGVVAAAATATAATAEAPQASQSPQVNSEIKQVGYYAPSAPGQFTSRRPPVRPKASPAYGAAQVTNLPPAHPHYSQAGYPNGAYRGYPVAPYGASAAAAVFPAGAKNAPAFGPAARAVNRIPQSYPQSYAQPAQALSRTAYAQAGVAAAGIGNVANYATGYAPTPSYDPGHAANAMGPVIDGVGGCNGGQMVGQPIVGMGPQMASPMMGVPMNVQMQAPYVEGPVMEGGCNAASAPSSDVYDSLWTEGGGDWSGGGGYVASAVPVSGGQCCRGLCGCDPCAPKAWLRAEVLLGWLSGYDVPALLNRSPLGGPLDDYSDDTTVYGGGNFGQDLRVGGRLTGGFWFDECRKWGFQVDAFSLGNDDDDANFVSSGDPILYRPFTNTADGGAFDDGQIIALDGTAVGSFRASTRGRLVSASPALRWNVNCCGDPCSGNATRLDLLAGYRYLQLREGFSSQEILRPQNDIYAAGTAFSLRDSIDTQNDFHGFEIGGILTNQRGALTTELLFTAAFGQVNRLYDVNGSTNLFVPGAVDDTYPGGFLVRPEDIGSYSDDEFTVVPQFRANLSYCFRPNVQLTIGYSFLYFDDVFRPGPLMTTSFDGRELAQNPASGVVGSSQPDPSTTDVFMNALSLGATFNY